MSRFFKGKNERSKWMRDISDDLAVTPHFFEIKFQYVQRNENRDTYLKNYREKKRSGKIVFITEKKEESIAERRKRFATYSNHSPMGIAGEI